MLGEWALDRHDFEQAAAWLEQSLRLHQQCGNEWMTQYVFMGMGLLAYARTQPERVLCLAGAEAALRQAHGPALSFDADIHWSPAEQHDWEQTVLAARAQVDVTNAAQIWAVGQAMTLDEAVVYALAGSKE